MTTAITTHWSQPILVLMVTLLGIVPAVVAQEGDVTFTEILRIGDESSEIPVFLSQVVSMAVDSRDQLYVTDFGFKGVLVFSSDGALLREIGREGRGPGEFMGPPFAHIGPGDTLYVLDRQLQRLTVFSPQDQSLIKSVTLRHADSQETQPYSVLGITDQGLLMVFTNTQSYLAQFVYRDGTVASDTVAHLRGADYVEFRMGSVSGARFLPYSARPHFALSADEVLYYGRSAAVDLIGIPLKGGEKTRITVPHEPIRITPEERSASVDAVRLDDLRKDLLANIPEYKPAFWTLLPDGKGHLWIELARPQNERTHPWEIINRKGVAVARAILPENMQLISVRGNRAYGELQDEATGAPMAVVWEISF
ncbi:MAG: 6-bladed beta-propeller [Bacteroidota bacterium]|nr:6-bladed beta-propeller [Bacteroidota bacterium]MDE2958165.1 6-bladed beta-propeller [Bacteroidota bacterium]